MHWIIWTLGGIEIVVFLTTIILGCIYSSTDELKLGKRLDFLIDLNVFLVTLIVLGLLSNNK